MKLAITATLHNPAFAVHYCEWTQQYFTEICEILSRNDIIQNGNFGDDIKKILLRDIRAGYTRLKSFFDVDETQMNDEEDTLVRLINTLSAEQYIELANSILTQYCHIEFDEASLEKLNKLGYL